MPEWVKEKISASMMGINNPFFGRHHSEETLKKLSQLCGHSISEEQKKEMSARFSGDENPFFGKTHCSETKLLISENTRISQTGRPKSVLERMHISRALTGNPKSEEHKAKISLNSKINVIKRKEKLGTLKIGYNPDACAYFDGLNGNRKWELQHALNGGEVRVLNYFVDAYDKKRNIVVEYDEHHHYDIYGKLKSKDRIRMENIIRCLNCQFYRYNESTKEFYESTENYEVIHT